MKQEAYKNILVHSMVNLGDVILSTAALELLRKAYPQAKITFMVRPGIAPVLKNHPYIDEVLAYDYKSKGDRLSVWRMAKELRKRQFDLSISLDRRPRLALLTWLAGIPVRVGPAKVFSDTTTWGTRFYTNVVTVPHDLKQHLQTENFQEIIRQFTKCETGYVRPVIGRPEQAAMDEAKRLLDSLPDKTITLAMCVKAVFPLKNWPKERFAAVISRLYETLDIRMFIVGAPEDREYADDIIRMAGVPVGNFCGQTSLEVLSALFFRSDMMISVDNGSAHVAAATNLPIVTLFTCTPPRRVKPSAEISIALGGELPCCPCDYAPEACPNDKQCLTAVSVDDVVKTAEQVIKQLEKCPPLGVQQVLREEV